MQEILNSYPFWKQLPNGQYVAISYPLTFGKARLLIDLDEIGYAQGF